MTTPHDGCPASELGCALIYLPVDRLRSKSLPLLHEPDLSSSNTHKGLTSPAAPVQVQINAVSPEVLSEARERTQQLDKARAAEEKSAPAPYS